VVTSWCDEVGALPTRNFSAGSFEQGPNIYGQTMRKEIVITDKGCFGCPSPCGKYSNMKRYNTQVEGPEYETIGMMGSNLGVGDIQAVAEANRLADDLGIDSISAGGCIGWAMECYEKVSFTKAIRMVKPIWKYRSVFAMIKRLPIAKVKWVACCVGNQTCCTTGW
jgi:aldehyde:ferredoxin oxidoreductase